jgi:hypothetical protein
MEEVKLLTDVRDCHARNQAPLVRLDSHVTGMDNDGELLQRSLFTTMTSVVTASA